MAMNALFSIQRAAPSVAAVARRTFFARPVVAPTAAPVDHDRYKYAQFRAEPPAFDNIGNKSFTQSKLQAAVSYKTFTNFKNSVKAESEANLSKSEKNEIAEALLKWALDNGCTNFAHWYIPMRNRDCRAAPAMKFDGFLNLDYANPSMLKPLRGKEFSGAQLFHGETDGSSFPNGGVRDTSRAAAYVTWDKTSDPYIRHDTLYIPSGFMTYNGEALDYKTPLLRAGAALKTQGLRVLRHMGDNDSKRVASNVGCEQEYFLMDADTFAERPDLGQCGRALFGALSPRNQECSENYFGAPSKRIHDYVTELRGKLWELGISVFVNHNEVAPGQVELSPIFCLSNQAADQNVLTMEVMEWIAVRHGLKVLFHEKPFANVNGSGKHNNWGLNTDTGKNLCAPGKTDSSQAEFAAFTSALMCAMHKHAGLIRAGVAVPGNDYRLGAQEAPPAIVSLATGESLYDHLQTVVAGGPLHGFGAESTQQQTFGAAALEPVQVSYDDRNRTAPFPFCGNRFEFRAVGSTQNIALPISLLDTAVADGLCTLADMMDGGKSPRDAVAELIEEHNAIIFNGDGYSQEWQDEAAGRGLPNHKNMVDAWRGFNSEANLDLFAKHNVMSKSEVESRKNINLSNYVNTHMIEGGVASRMAKTMFLSACAKDLQSYEGAADALAGDRPAVYKAVASASAKLDEVLEGFPEDVNEQDQADYCVDHVKPMGEELRAAVDAAEVLCAAELWPVPTYQEMLLTLQNQA